MLETPKIQVIAHSKHPVSFTSHTYEKPPPYNPNYTPSNQNHAQGPPPYNPSNYGRPPAYSPAGQPPAYNAAGSHPPAYSPAGYGHPPAYNPAGYGHPPAYNPAGYGHPPAYNPGYNPAGYGHPPAYNPAGYGAPPAYGYGHPPAGYGGSYHYPGGGGGTTIINNNNYHYGGGGGYGGGYGGGWAPSYRYSSFDTGSSALGFFLGYSLAKITTPSFLYHGSSYGGGYTPRYDHYEVHHYYHNRDNVPKEAEIQQNAIVGCVGDSGSFCPANTTSLCTNNGAVMCVASATTTVPCTNDRQTNCVSTTVPCVNNTAPECKDSSQKETAIRIPCISTAKVYGDISYVNNTIVVANATTEANSTIATSTNSTDNNSTVITTTLASNITNSTASEKKGPPQTFCVTILALPAPAKQTEGGKLFEGAKNVFGMFAVKALGIE
nr:unnamed protein product [Callosobruchus analis]